jgi:hypothetical protein
VPLPIIGSAMFGATGGFGALFMIVGLLFTIPFLHGYRPIDDVRLALSQTTARGVITRVGETNSTENDVEVYEYEFTFTSRREEKVTGRSYATGRLWSVEDDVTVEYIPEDPAIARIRGARSSTFSPWVLFVLIFPGVGAGLFLAAANSGLKQVWLLRNGIVADARILSSRPTGTTVNNNPIMVYSYEVRTREGATLDGSSKAFPFDRIGDEEIEPALYLPSNPALSTLVDAISLQYPLDVDGLSGQWVSQGGKAKFVLYVLIWITALLLGGYGFLRMLGVIR